jgi:hypothetical protein
MARVHLGSCDRTRDFIEGEPYQGSPFPSVFGGGGDGYFIAIGDENAASPSTTSAQAHHICTFTTSAI